MISDHRITQDEFAYPPVMEAGNGTERQTRPTIPVEYWLSDDRFRVRNGAALARAAVDKEKVVTWLDAIYPGIGRQIRELEGWLPRREALRLKLDKLQRFLEHEEAYYAKHPSRWWEHERIIVAAHAAILRRDVGLES